ncbi:MAG: aminotransferase class IV [Halobacteriales archaeon]
MSDPVYHVDGDLVPGTEATVSVEDRGFLYGDAAFETLRAYGGSVFAWDAHRERLENTCASLGMEDAVPADLRERVRETLAANDFRDAYLRVSVTRGVQPGKLTPRPDVDPTVVVIAKPLLRGGLEGEPVWEAPATVETVDTRRVDSAAIPAGAKTHNYLNGILARLELDGEADEALLLDADGAVAEGATSNLFFVEDGTLKTPSTEGDLLPGVTRSVVLDIASDESFPVEEGRYDPDTVRRADEVFLTNTTWEVRPVTKLDRWNLDVGAITRLLARLFRERIENEQYV